MRKIALVLLASLLALSAEAQFRLQGELGRPGPTIPVARAADIEVTATGFDGNLETTDNTLQEIAQKVDDLIITGGSGNGDFFARTIAEGTADTTIIPTAVNNGNAWRFSGINAATLSFSANPPDAAGDWRQLVINTSAVVLTLDRPNNVEIGTLRPSESAIVMFADSTNAWKMFKVGANPPQYLKRPSTSISSGTGGLGINFFNQDETQTQLFIGRTSLHSAVGSATTSNNGLLGSTDFTKLSRIGSSAACAENQIWKANAAGVMSCQADDSALDAAATAKLGRLPDSCTSSGQVMKWNTTSTNFLCAPDAGVNGVTVTETATNVALDLSNTDTDDLIEPATTVLSGVMLPGDKIKVNRIPSGACALNEIWKSNASGVMTCQVDSGSGGGLTQAQVDARISSQVDDWAETANPSILIPINKLSGSQSATIATLRIAWRPDDGAFTSSDFISTNAAIGDTSGLIIPYPPEGPLQEFLGVWVGAPQANITDIRFDNQSFFSDLSVRSALLINGISGTLFRTSTSLPQDTVLAAQGSFMTVELTSLHLGDVIDHRITDEVEDWARRGDNHIIPDNKLSNNIARGDDLTVGYRVEATTDFDLLDGTPDFEEITINIPQRLQTLRDNNDIDLYIEAEGVAQSATGTARLDILNGATTLATSGITILNTLGVTMTAAGIVPDGVNTLTVRVTRTGSAFVTVTRLTGDVLPEYLRNVPLDNLEGTGCTTGQVIARTATGFTCVSASGVTPDGVTDALSTVLSDRVLTTTLGRTGALADLSDTVTLPFLTISEIDERVDLLSTIDLIENVIVDANERISSAAFINVTDGNYTTTATLTAAAGSVDPAFAAVPEDTGHPTLASSLLIDFGETTSTGVAESDVDYHHVLVEYATLAGGVGNTVTLNDGVIAAGRAEYALPAGWTGIRIIVQDPDTGSQSVEIHDIAIYHDAATEQYVQGEIRGIETKINTYPAFSDAGCSTGDAVTRTATGFTCTTLSGTTDGVLVYYIDGQTGSRFLPDVDTSGQTLNELGGTNAQRYARVRWNNSADESYFNSFTVTWLTSAQAEASQIDQHPSIAEVVPADHIFTLSEGIYNIELGLWGGDLTAENAREALGLFSIEPNSDAGSASVNDLPVFLLKPTGGNAPSAPLVTALDEVQAVYQGQYKYLSVPSGGKSYYVLLFGVDDPTVAGYLSIEKLRS